MEYGPCGGVGADGSCEAGSFPCVFLDRQTRPWEGVDGAHPVPPGPRTSAAEATMQRLAAGRLVVADLPARAADEHALAACASILSGRVDAVLAGDSPDARVQYPPSLRAVLLGRQGIAVWSGVNCRDRNRVALEGEVAGLAVAGAAAVHCVTGDHTSAGHRPDAMPVFDLDGVELAAVARGAGHLVSVAEAPAAPPVGDRVARLRVKEAAGADVCFIDHCGGTAPVRRFVRSAQDAGSELRFIACVPVVFDVESASALDAFPGLVLPAGFMQGIAGAADPRRAGIDAAIALAEELLEIDGVDGIDLSGGSGPGGELAFAEAVAEVADGITGVAA